MRMVDLINKKRLGEELSAEDRQNSFHDMMKIALEVAAENA